MLKMNAHVMLCKAMIPSSVSLFEVVERFLQQTNMVRKMSVPEIGWLVHVYSFLKIVVKKFILHIKLMNRPLV